ncbi:MAG TPA: Rieske (2Fe-2S) protein, partial [Chloroflexia bacterium]|nr:Rieske (2Fe-2S) protein [Chloroflexia bacterium]
MVRKAVRDPRAVLQTSPRGGHPDGAEPGNGAPWAADPLPAESPAHWQRAAALPDLEPDGRKTVHVAGRTLVLWRQDGRIYALDNRCPHMGFPLDRGTCRDGILTCHWHAARFDLQTGGTF